MTPDKSQKANAVLHGAFAVSLAASVAMIAVMGTSGCALTSKADIVTVRYFSPEQIKPHLTQAESASRPAANEGSQASTPAVRLGRVSSGANLRERIAYRGAAYELGYYEDWRWTERPEAFVRRQLARKLFEEHRFQRVLTGSAPTIEVELIAFDDLRLPTGRAARVQFRVIVFESATVLYEDTLTVDQPVTVARPTIEDVVAAMAAALDTAAEKVAARLGTALNARRPPAEAPPRPR